MDLLPIAAAFLIRLVLGYVLWFGWLEPRITKGPWPRVSLFVIAGIAVVGIAAGGSPIGLGAVALAALVVERGRTFGVRILRTPLWLLPGALYAAWAAVSRPAFDAGATADLAAGGVIAGGTFATMLLGHSYLTARGLSFDPFKAAASVLFWILVLHTAGSCAVVLQHTDRIEGMDWVFVSARFAFGLFLPLLFGWMVVRCVRIESNQSATGILYAMTALVWAGELFSIYLRLERGIGL